MRIVLNVSAMILSFVCTTHLNGTESIHEQLYDFVVTFEDMKPAEFNRQATWQTLQQLLESGASFKTADIDINTLHRATGASMLYCAIRAGSLEAAYLLIALGANPNLQERILGNAPLHTAAEKGYTDLINYLYAQTADPNLKNHDGQTPLHKAVLAQQTEAVALLLTHKKIFRHIADKYGKQPIDYAKARGYEAIITLLSKS